MKRLRRKVVQKSSGIPKKNLKKIKPFIDRKYLKIDDLNKNWTTDSSRQISSGVPELAERYGENKITLLVRDPWWLFAYWEVTPECRAEVRRLAREKGFAPEKTVLRVYDVTDAPPQGGRPFFDIETGAANSWYIDVGKPDRRWAAELGTRTREGEFFAFVRSNSVRTPRFGVSDVVDKDWMMSGGLYQKLFGPDSGFGIGSSELQKSHFK